MNGRFTRKQLYDWVWSQPMRTVAASVGISDVALAKHCKKADIPVPNRGYAMLLKYAWYDDECFPGQATLATDMGSGERSVRRYLDELEKVKLLEVVKRGLGKTNVYRLFLTVQKPSSHGRR
jgi:hypothetical protein